ncbi:TPA: metallophosphoesterase [Vibrio harveyi]|nr:metallophosphoesterase [Vibrio harveyi]
MSTQTLNILHISDVHFQANEKTHTQDRIVEALVEAVQNYEKPIDYCVFTGDLANHALASEYKLAESWLEDIFSAMDNPEAKMLICPGNHDVDRKLIKPVTARGAASSQDMFNEYLEELEDSFLSLSNFKRWHSEFKRKNSWVVSEWDKHVNLVSDINNDFNINFIMANTALLSCNDSDQGNLCVDLNQLNACLGQSNRLGGLNICMMHHPIEGGWFTDWNQRELENLLSQQTGCHFLMSGHVHDAEGHSRANNYGQSLTNFKCGSAYTGGKWKKEFSILEINIEASRVTPNNFVFSELSGNWNKNNEQSQSILVDFESAKRKVIGKKKLT